MGFAPPVINYIWGRLFVLLIKKVLMQSIVVILFLLLVLGFTSLLGVTAINASKVEASGTQPLGSLQIGDRVVDSSWKWEHRLGVCYSNKDYEGNSTPLGETKPITWIVVANEHYGAGSGVTLLAEELIGLQAFSDYDDTNRGGWGAIGTENAIFNLRPWLNSTGIHSDEGFHITFSDSFKAAVVPVTLPNVSYTTQDRVFIPSTTELGDTRVKCELCYFNPIGKAYPYFASGNEANRIAMLGKDVDGYFTRAYAYNPGAPDADVFMHVVDAAGSFDYGICYFANGVRPALNLKSNTLVSLTTNADGAYIIVSNPDTDTEITIGNIKGYGEIDINDATLAIKHVLELASLNEKLRKGADVNGDGKIDVLDVSLIVQKVLGLIDKFPAE